MKNLVSAGFFIALLIRAFFTKLSSLKPSQHDYRETF